MHLRIKFTLMVTLKTVDRLVGLLVVGLLLYGSYGWWRATQRARATDGMMGQMMSVMPGTDPIWYLFGTLVAVSVVLGVYVGTREQLVSMLATSISAGVSEDDPEKEYVSTDDRSLERPSEESVEESSMGGSLSERNSVLSVLPEDERRVVEPILRSPGLTQVELRGRSDFSKAKVSQTVSELEERGLIYREKQGRTYRVYPGELLKERQS